jgi:purine-nucleoside phosphorylase
VASTDLFYEASGEERERWIDAGAIAVEMEAAALFSIGPRVGVAVACMLVVSDAFPQGRRERISEPALAEAVERMGAAAAAALSP